MKETQNEKEEVDVFYCHAVGVFFHGVLHVSELWPEALDVLLELQLSLLAALQLRHSLIQLALHTVELQKTHENHHVSCSNGLLWCLSDSRECKITSRKHTGKKTQLSKFIL